MYLGALGVFVYLSFVTSQTTFRYLLPTYLPTDTECARTNVTGRSAAFIEREIAVQLARLTSPDDWSFSVVEVTS